MTTAAPPSGGEQMTCSVVMETIHLGQCRGFTLWGDTGVAAGKLVILGKDVCCDIAQQRAYKYGI